MMEQAAQSRMRRTLDERLADLALRQRQLEARRLALLAAKKGEDRKRDTRRKIIVGAAVLMEAERDPAFAAQLRGILGRTVQRPAERAVVEDFLEPAVAGEESA